MEREHSRAPSSPFFLMQKVTLINIILTNYGFFRLYFRSDIKGKRIFGLLVQIVIKRKLLTYIFGRSDINKIPPFFFNK